MLRASTQEDLYRQLESLGKLVDDLIQAEGFTDSLSQSHFIRQPFQHSSPVRNYFSNFFSLL